MVELHRRLRDDVSRLIQTVTLLQQLIAAPTSDQAELIASLENFMTLESDIKRDCREIESAAGVIGELSCASLFEATVQG